MVSHGNLMYNLGLIQRCFEHSPRSQGVIWLPPYHDMGLIGGILQPLYCGFPVTLMSPLYFLQRPFRWLEAVSRYKATTSGGPDFAYDLCVQTVRPEQRASIDLSSWDVAFNGAEPIRAATLDRFSEYFEPCGFRREAFYPCYGLAETTLIASGGSKTARPIVKTFLPSSLQKNAVADGSAENESGRLLVGCGRSMEGQRLAIVDPATLRPCRSDEIGEIWVSGPSVARGYWKGGSESARTFAACTGDSNEGPFLRTGDLGFLQDGELFVTGRLKDLIIIDGANHYPQDIEWTVENSHRALRAGGCAAFSVDASGGERLVVAAEVDIRYRRNVRTRGEKIPANHEPGHGSSLAAEDIVVAVRKAIAEYHDLQVDHVVLLKPGGIPRTSSGKVQRYACKAHYVAGTFDTLEE